MAKAIKIAGAVVIGAGLILATGGIAAGFTLGAALGAGSGVLGLSIGGLILAGSTIATLGSSLDRPKVPQVQNDRLYAQLNPREFRKTVLGQTALPVDVRHEEWEGSSQEWYRWIVGHASHGIDGVDEIWFGTEMAWSATTGVTAKYRGYFFVDAIVLEGTPSNALALSNQWNGTRHLTGCAYSAWRFKTTGNSKKADSPFSGGPPSRITVIGRGAKLYDPRRDSTVPGGNGPMRADDQSTWRFVTDDGVTIGENLPLQILRVALGGRIRNPLTGEMRLATGSGVPKRRINMASFIVAANLADERVNRSAGGTEPRYHGACVLSEGDEPRTWFDMLCTACNARFRDTGGKLSIDIAHNDFASAATDDGLTTDDVVGPHRWEPDASLEAIPNIVRGKYVDASAPSLYQLIDYPEIRIASLDGVDRILSLDLGAVESVSHAQRVGKQVLQRKQYPRTFTAPFDIRAWKYPVGALVPFTYAPLGFNRVLFRVREQELGQGGECVMTLSYEHPSFYAWDADDRAPVMAADPIVYDNRNNPLILAIGDAARTAEWDQVTDPTGRKPQDNATVGAPIGTKIAGRPAEKLIADFDKVETDLKSALSDIGDINTDLSAALGKFDGVFETVELLTPSVFNVVRMFGTLNSYMRARTTLEGMPIGTVVVETREKTDSAVEDLKLLGARSLDGTAFSLDLTTVMVDAKTSLAQRFTQIEAKGAGDLNALASTLTTAITEGNKAAATRLETLEVGAKGLSAKVQSLQEAVVDGENSLVRQLSTLKASNSLMSTTIKDLEEATVSGTNSVAKRVGVIESSLNTADTGVWARIGKAEQVIIANNTATLTKFEELNAAIYSPNGGVKATISDLVEATLTGDKSVAKRVSTIELSLNTADTGVWARIGTAEQAIVTQGRVLGERIQTLETGLNTPGTGVWARIGTAEQAISEQGRGFSSRISSIEAGLNAPDTGVWARVGSAEQAIVTANKALATFKQDVTASLDTPGTGLKAKVGLLLSATVDAQAGAEAKAVLALDSQGLVSGIVGTNNGKISRISFKFSQTDFFRPDGTLLVRIGNADAGDDPNAVYMPKVIVDTIAAKTVKSEHMTAGSASGTRFAVITQDKSIPRDGSYYTVATVSFRKEEVGSMILVRTSLNVSSPDDLQFKLAMTVSLNGGGDYIVPSDTNMVFDNRDSNARMPISPFAVFLDPAVQNHTGYLAINITIRNTEVDNVPLTIAAGSVIEFVEVKAAMLAA